MRRGAACLFVVLALSGIALADELPSAAQQALTLTQSTDPYQRELGFMRLEALRDPAVLPSIRPYTHSRDPDTRAQSARAVAAIEGPAAVPALIELYRKEKVARVRRAILLGLEPHAATDPELLPLFIDALRDRATDVRMAAVDIVSRIDDPRAREAIQFRVKHEWRKDVRRVLRDAAERSQQQP